MLGLGICDELIYEFVKASTIFERFILFMLGLGMGEAQDHTPNLL